MPAVTTSYRLSISRRHRRRRRIAGQPAIIELVAPTTNVITGRYDPVHVEELPYRPQGTETARCPFLFWSVRGAADGSYTRTEGRLEVPVGDTDVTVTAWYRLPSAGGGGGGGDPFVEVDAFSVALDDFVDETPIAHADPASALGAGEDDNLLLTASGPVSADVLNRLSGDASIRFERWVALAPGRGEDQRLQEEEKADGFAICSYRRPAVENLEPVLLPPEGGLVLGLIPVDGGGVIIGPDGLPRPVGPWDPSALKALFASGLSTIEAPPWTPARVSEIQKLAAQILHALDERVAKVEVVVARPPIG